MMDFILFSIALLLGVIQLLECNSLSFDYLQSGDAETVLDNLKNAGHSAESIFTIRNQQEMLQKKSLPQLGPWIEKTARFEFQERDPQITFQQIIKAEQHLKVSGVGCKNFKCKSSVNAVGKSYDKLIINARRVSSDSVQKTIQMIQFLKDGVKDSKKRDESLKKCIPIAEKLAKDYEELGTKASDLQDVAVKAVAAIERDNLQISKKEKKDAVILNKIKGILDQAKAVEKVRGCNPTAMSDISSVMKMIRGFKSNLDHDFEISLKAMSAASVSMKLIKTMTLDIKEFWEDQVLLIQKIVEKDNEFAGIDGLEVDIAEIGLYWFVFGTTSIAADNLMVKRYGRLFTRAKFNRRLRVSSRKVMISPDVSNHVFGVIYFKLNKNEKRKIALEGSKIITASQAIVDKLYEDCSTSTPLDVAFRNIIVDRNKLPYSVTVKMGRRPTAKGQISEVNSRVHTAWVHFPDDRKYKFWYYPTEATIYWDNDKGKTNNVWKGRKPILTSVDEAFRIITVDRTRVPYKVSVIMGGRPKATGQISELNKFVQTGYVHFPDDRRYNFWYYPEEMKIYWDNDKGKTSNIWTGRRPGELTSIDTAFRNINVDRTRAPYKLLVNMGSRPKATGQISELNKFVQTGYVNFPDDRRYNFWYHTEEMKIYWDNDKGKTSIIWTGRRPGELTSIDTAFTIISVDRTRMPYKVSINMGARPKATGQISEINKFVQTGYVHFPDDRRYNFWYYPEEMKIYWDNDKGKTSNIWTGRRPDKK